MFIKVTAQLRGHDVLLSFRLRRRVAYMWVVRHAADIVALEIDCGLNIWSWSPEVGWTQFPQVVYTPGKGTHHANVKPIRRGNSYDAIHPWRYCLDEQTTPNPLCIVDINSPF